MAKRTGSDDPSKSVASSTRPTSSDSFAQTDRLLAALGEYSSQELLELLYIGQEPGFFELARRLLALSDESRLALQNFLANTATGNKAKLVAFSEGSQLVLQNFPINPETGNEARRAIETDNARERARFLSEVACLTSKEVAQNAGHQAANAGVTGSRWEQQGRIFSVPSRGSELYPAFQFRDGQPHPAVAKILRELPKQMSPWQIAFWFTSSNSWLRGVAPADRLDDEDAVVKAAHRESEPIVG
jgi:hypothetical protein